MGTAGREREMRKKNGKLWKHVIRHFIRYGFDGEIDSSDGKLKYIKKEKYNQAKIYFVPE